MTKNTKKSGLVVKSAIKAGGMAYNHNRAAAKKSGLVVKTTIKAGGMAYNHNRAR